MTILCYDLIIPAVLDVLRVCTVVSLVDDLHREQFDARGLRETGFDADSAQRLCVFCARLIDVKFVFVCIDVSPSFSELLRISPRTLSDTQKKETKGDIGRRRESLFLLLAIVKHMFDACTQCSGI